MKHIRTVLLSRFCLSVCLSVRPSVCPSVKRVYCDKTKAPSEKSSIITNTKSPTSFPMSLRWTSYVALKPPKGTSKATILLFPYKNGLRWKKCAAKFVCVKTVSGKAVRYSLAYPSVQKWLVGDVPFCVKFWVKMAHPASKTAIFTRYSPVATVLWQNEIIVCKFMNSIR